MDFLQPLAAVGFTMALLGVTLMLLKKRGLARGGARRMQALERLSLGQHHTLHLIQVDGRPLLIASGPSSVQILKPFAGQGFRPARRASARRSEAKKTAGSTSSAAVYTSAAPSGSAAAGLTSGEAQESTSDEHAQVTAAEPRLNGWVPPLFDAAFGGPCAYQAISCAFVFAPGSALPCNPEAGK